MGFITLLLPFTHHSSSLTLAEHSLFAMLNVDVHPSFPAPIFLSFTSSLGVCLCVGLCLFQLCLFVYM